MKKTIAIITGATGGLGTASLERNIASERHSYLECRSY